ncbi:hypothetical protein ACLB2K_000607 [Fragaria x ananassa]
MRMVVVGWSKPDLMGWACIFSGCLIGLLYEQRRGLVQLQKELISRTDLGDVHEGATMIKIFLRHKRVLLVLDDVNHPDQLAYLAGKEDWFGFGSIIIFTTRDAHLLDKHGVLRRYEVQGLNTNEALQFFCQNAFKKDYPEQSYRDLSNQVVNYAKGLPLALKVLGSFLHGRDVPVSESALAKLRKVGNAEIFGALKISYDGLDDHEKNIFLDIALFHIGYTKHAVMRLLDACDFAATIGIDVLEKRSLLTIDAGILQMHDLLREMGLEIVRRESPDEPGKRSRLCLEEDFISVLEKNRQLKSLKHIDLSRSLNLCKTPDFSGCPDLESLNLDGCIQLYEVDSSVGFLERLTSMFLKGCKNLRLLPSSVSGSKSLKILDLSDCSKLEKLPEDFGHLEILEELYVNGTALRELPPCMGLQNLKILAFYRCTGPPISKLLPSFAGLHSLTKLNLSHSNLLEGAIPDNIDCLSSLKELHLSGNQYVTLPEVSQYLNEEARDTPFWFVIPGNEIPEWFDQTVTAPLNGQESKSIDLDCTLRKEFYHTLGRAVPDHLSFSYDNDLSSYFRRADTTELKQIEFSFRVKGQGLVVKKYGVRLVYEQDVAEVNQSNAAISNEALEIPVCDSGKAAVVSHAISKRSLLPHSHVGGGPSGSAFSFYNLSQIV